jgi:hypothetical protein
VPTFWVLEFSPLFELLGVTVRIHTHGIVIHHGLGWGTLVKAAGASFTHTHGPPIELYIAEKEREKQE